MLKRLLIFVPVFAAGIVSFGQYTTTGSATSSGCGEWTVTPDAPSQTGSFYKNATIDLTNSFTLKFDVNFGCDDNGGSGLVFVMRNGKIAERRAWVTVLQENDYR